MTTNTAETEESTQATGVAVEPKPAKKAARAAQKAHVAPTKGKSAESLVKPGAKACWDCAEILAKNQTSVLNSVGKSVSLAGGLTLFY